MFDWAQTVQMVGWTWIAPFSRLRHGGGGDAKPPQGKSECCRPTALPLPGGREGDAVVMFPFPASVCRRVESVNLFSSLCRTNPIICSSEPPLVHLAADLALIFERAFGAAVDMSRFVQSLQAHPGSHPDLRRRGGRPGLAKEEEEGEAHNSSRRAKNRFSACKRASERASYLGAV